MKLFLSSESVSYEQGYAFAKLIGKPLSDTEVAYIDNAADVAAGNATWVNDNRAKIEALGCRVIRVDLRDFKDSVRKISLTEALKPFDVIWIGGGNTYYLRWILYKTRADIIIPSLIKQGKIYGGGSAGAIVAGPTINYFQAADDPSEADEVILDGLHLTETVVIPHWHDEGYSQIMRVTEEKLKQSGYKTQHITNTQALVIDGDKQTIIPG